MSECVDWKPLHALPQSLTPPAPPPIHPFLVSLSSIHSFLRKGLFEPSYYLLIPVPVAGDTVVHKTGRSCPLRGCVLPSEAGRECCRELGYAVSFHWG